MSLKFEESIVCGHGEPKDSGDSHQEGLEG